MTTRGVKIGEDVTITLPAEQWDALIRTGVRSWADTATFDWDEDVRKILDHEGFPSFSNLRTKAITMVERATPGAAARKEAVHAVLMSMQAELDKETITRMKELVAECVEAYKHQSRDCEWSHLGVGNDAPGGRCGFNDGFGVGIMPNLPHLFIERWTPYLDGSRAWGFTKQEKGILDRLIKDVAGRDSIIESWGGGEWYTYKLTLTTEVADAA